MTSPYVATITRDNPLLGAAPSTGYRGTVHAWYESVGRSGRRGPNGSRALCGVRSNGWCVEWNGFIYHGPADIVDAESISYFGSMCPDCKERLPVTDLGDGIEETEALT